MTMDRKLPPYKPKIYHVRSRNQNVSRQNFTPRNRSLVEEETKVVIEGLTTIETLIGQIIELDQEADGTTIGQVIGVAITRITIDEAIRDWITDKMLNGLLETEVKVGIEMKIMIMIIQEVGVEIDMIIDPFNREEKNLGPSLTPGWVLIVIE